MISNLDIALVGNNYLTYLLSLALLDKGRSVLVFDDESFNYGLNYLERLSQLDVEMIKQWANESGINPLVNIDSYLTPAPYYLVIGKKQVLLGRSPQENLQELKRKFSYLFHFQSEIDQHDEIDHLYHLTASDMAKFLYADHKNVKLHEFIEQQLESSVKESFKFFFKNFHKAENNEFSVDEKNDFNSFIYTARGLLQNRLGISAHKTEALHLYLALISPNYKLDHKKLITDLAVIYKEKGGVIKKGEVGQLALGSGFVKRFALESFDGMIRPKKTIFMGGHPNQIKSDIGVVSRHAYNCLNLKVKFNKTTPKDYIGKKYVFSSAIKIGTDRPYWEVEFTGERDAVFNIIMSEKEGSKVEFYKSTVERILINDLNYIFAELDLGIESSKLSFTRDILLDDFNVYSYRKKDRDFKRSSMNPFGPFYSLLRPRLKDTLYFGPFYDSWLGRYSSLVELRRWKEGL